MNPDRIIFLDIDGVLNSYKFWITHQNLSWFEDTISTIKRWSGDIRAWNARQLDPHAVSLLAELVKETDSKIVISSAWRSKKIISELGDLFLDIGVDFPVESIIGTTPRGGGIDHKDYSRGAEIERWITENSFNGTYVIIDDESDMLPHQSFVKTSPFEGFDYTAYSKCKLVLTGQTESRLGNRPQWLMERCQEECIYPVCVVEYDTSKVEAPFQISSIAGINVSQAMVIQIVLDTLGSDTDRIDEFFGIKLTHEYPWEYFHDSTVKLYCEFTQFSTDNLKPNKVKIIQAPEKIT